MVSDHYFWFLRLGVEEWKGDFDLLPCALYFWNFEVLNLAMYYFYNYFQRQSYCIVEKGLESEFREFCLGTLIPRMIA